MTEYDIHTIIREFVQKTKTLPTHLMGSFEQLQSMASMAGTMGSLYMFTGGVLKLEVDPTLDPDSDSWGIRGAIRPSTDKIDNLPPEEFLDVANKVLSDKLCPDTLTPCERPPAECECGCGMR